MFRQWIRSPADELRTHSVAITNVCMLVTNRGVDDPRVCMEAEALACRDYKVTVIGWDRDADKDTDVCRNGVRFLRLKLRSTHGRGITQPIYLAGFWLRALPVIRRLRPDVIHCHDLDTLPVGLFSAGRLRARLIFDAHENYPDMMVGHLPPTAVRVLRWLEHRLVPRCDLVITVGNRLAEHYRHMGARKVVVVGNWKDPADFKFPPDTISRTRRELGLPSGIIAICFVANLGPERRLEPLLAAVADDKRFACVIGGDGSQADVARQYAETNDNITYLGRVEPELVPLITAACDVVYYGFDETNPNAQWSAPNKLYEAIAAGKPVLTGNFGEIGQTVREGGCGVIGDLCTKAGLTSALASLSKPGKLNDLGSRAVQAGRIYSRKQAIVILLNTYNSVAKSAQRKNAGPILKGT